ncbi:G-protein coupled receptor 4-like [Lepisosteus oculatus]|uniref:G-protein coupled receptor 4-like n=1 Tax=Lepisosteus oculatus TaxID=7918 RepID=UPI003722BB36
MGSTGHSGDHPTVPTNYTPYPLTPSPGHYNDYDFYSNFWGVLYDPDDYVPDDDYYYFLGMPNPTGNTSTNLEVAATVTKAMHFSVLGLGLPVICLALFKLYRQFTDKEVVCFYVMNLLVADLLQLSVVPLTRGFGTDHLCLKFDIFNVLFNVGVNAGIGFMACITLERYLVVAHPLWYRYRRTANLAVRVSAAVWALVATDTTLYMFLSRTPGQWLSFWTVHFLLPLPFLVFCGVGTWRAVAGAIAVSEKEKRKVRRSLALVLGSYVGHFLPFYATQCFYYVRQTYGLRTDPNAGVPLRAAAFVLFSLHVLTDPALYIFLRSDSRRTLRRLWRRLTRGGGGPADQEGGPQPVPTVLVTLSAA